MVAQNAKNRLSGHTGGDVVWPRVESSLLHLDKKFVGNLLSPELCLVLCVWHLIIAAARGARYPWNDACKRNRSLERQTAR